MLENKQKNKRNYFRIYFKTPLCASMTIALINNKPINTGKTRVCIEDISASGLRFISNVKMPISEGIILDFVTHIFNDVTQFSGYIVRRNEIENNIWEYGVQFLAVEKTSSEYLEILNKLNIKLKKKYNIDDCSFCEKKSKRECLKLQLIKNKK